MLGMWYMINKFAGNLAKILALRLYLCLLDTKGRKLDRNCSPRQWLSAISIHLPWREGSYSSSQFQSASGFRHHSLKRDILIPNYELENKLMATLSALGLAIQLASGISLTLLNFCIISDSLGCSTYLGIWSYWCFIFLFKNNSSIIAI